MSADNKITRTEFEALPAIATRESVERVGNDLKRFGARLRIAVQSLRFDGREMCERFEMQSPATRLALIAMLSEASDQARGFVELIDAAHARAVVASGFCVVPEQPPERLQ